MTRSEALRENFEEKNYKLQKKGMLRRLGKSLKGSRLFLSEGDIHIVGSHTI